eukprot:358456_1
MSDVWFDTMIHCHDAFIFAGCTPPEARYYNIGSYTQNRYNVNITDTSANITQYALFPQEASLSSSLNYLNINITTGNSFNSLTTIIHTGDNATYSDIMNALNYTSVSNSNLIQIPHDYFKFAPYGVNNRNFATYPLEFNSYLPLWRLESPLNKTEYTQYVSKNPNRLQTVYYLQYKHIDPSNDTQNVVDPFIPYTDIHIADVYDDNNAVNQTAEYINDFNQYMDDLIVNISKTYNFKFINETEGKYHKICRSEGKYLNLNNSGYGCIDNIQKCDSLNPDGVYFICGGIPITDNDFYIIAGINCYKTNTTVFENICYNVGPGDLMVGVNNSVLTNWDLDNSALNLNISTNINSQIIDKFWVIQVARPNVFISGIQGFNVSYKVANSSQKIDYWIRNYLHANTKTKPNYLNMMHPQFIRFEVPDNINP